MGPRKSASSRRARASSAQPPADPAAIPPATPIPKLRQSISRPQRSDDDQPVASSSKVTLDDMPPQVPESITWDYEAPPRKRQKLCEEDKERFMHELLKFSPFFVLHDISEHARNNIYPKVSSVEQWAEREAGNRPAFKREVEKGSHALETLLENHVDQAFDKFTAYALRNTFKVPDNLELVMPWHRDIDFDRAAFVTSIEGGEEELARRLTRLRTQVEEARLVRHRLALAEAELDRRLEIAAHRRAQVGFVRDAVADAGLAPLPEKASNIASTLTTMHTHLDALDTPLPRAGDLAATPSTEGNAWEAGRQAYNAWSLPRALDLAGGGAAAATVAASRPGEMTADRLGEAEREVAGVGSADDVEALGKAVGK